MMWSFQGRESKKCIWMVFWVDNTQPHWMVCARLLEFQEESVSPWWSGFVSGDLGDCPKGLWGKDSPSSQVPTGLQMWGRNRWQPTGRTARPLLWSPVLQRGQPRHPSGVRF